MDNRNVNRRDNLLDIDKLGGSLYIQQGKQYKQVLFPAQVAWKYAFCHFDNIFAVSVEGQLYCIKGSYAFEGNGDNPIVLNDQRLKWKKIGYLLATARYILLSEDGKIFQWDIRSAPELLNDIFRWSDFIIVEEQLLLITGGKLYVTKPNRIFKTVIPLKLPQHKEVKAWKQVLCRGDQMYIISDGGQLYKWHGNWLKDGTVTDLKKVQVPLDAVLSVSKLSKNEFMIHGSVAKESDLKLLRISSNDALENIRSMKKCNIYMPELMFDKYCVSKEGSGIKIWDMETMTPLQLPCEPLLLHSSLTWIIKREANVPPTIDLVDEKVMRNSVFGSFGVQINTIREKDKEAKPIISFEKQNGAVLQNNTANEPPSEAHATLQQYNKQMMEKLAALQAQVEFEKAQKQIEIENILKQQQEARCYEDLLRNLNNLAGSQKIKCFISYAWETDPTENAKLQGRLVRLKEDLMKAGIEVLLDIHNMAGDIDVYMTNEIAACDKVLLICTPRFKLRADDPSCIPNNLQKEFRAALERQKGDNKFIVPLLFSGDFASSISSSMPNILCLDFRDPHQYTERMVSLSPKGLIPMLYDWDNNKIYPSLLQGYRDGLKLADKRHSPV